MTPKSPDIADPLAPEVAVKPFSAMSEAELEAWDRGFIAALEAGDDSAARASLAAGVPIYYAEEDTPADGMIKEYPDGRRELVTFANGVESAVWMLQVQRLVTRTNDRVAHGIQRNSPNISRLRRCLCSSDRHQTVE